MATHSSVLAWRIPGTGEPGGLPSMGSCRVGHDWSDLAAAAAEWLASQFEGHGSHFWQTILWDSHALEHVSLSLSVYHSGGIFPKMRTSQIVDKHGPWYHHLKTAREYSLHIVMLPVSNSDCSLKCNSINWWFILKVISNDPFSPFLKIHQRLVFFHTSGALPSLLLDYNGIFNNSVM